MMTCTESGAILPNAGSLNTHHHANNNLNPIKHNDSINIATHNVQGINNKLKWETWLEFCVRENLHIVSLTETKLPEGSATKLKLLNPYYKIFTANCTETEAKKNPASMGAALANRNPIQPYIQNVQSLPAVAVMLDFAFPKNNKIRVISLYLPSNNHELLLKTQQQIMQWITTAQKTNH